MSVLSVAVEHWKIYFLAWFLRFIFSLCEWFKCHFSMQLCSEWVEGVLAFWVEMVYMLKPLALSVWLCDVHCLLDTEILLSSWRRGMQCRYIVPLSVVCYLHIKNMPWLIVYFIHIEVSSLLTKNVHKTMNGIAKTHATLWWLLLWWCRSAQYSLQLSCSIAVTD